MPFLYVFLGGGLGSMARFAISKGLQNYTIQFPWATLIANALACIILGYLSGLFLKNEVNETIKYALMIGFCGGFSTFSTFSLETFKLIEQGNILNAGLNILGSVILCMVCIYLGIKLSR